MRRFVFLVVLLAAACDRSPSEPPGRPSTVAREPVRRAPTVQDTSYRLPGGDRIVAFGDVHGDVGGVRAVLRLAGVIDDKDAWIGKKTIVVQTGDQLDRGDTEPEVLDLFDDLAKKAKAAGIKPESVKAVHIHGNQNRIGSLEGSEMMRDKCCGSAVARSFSSAGAGAFGVVFAGGTSGAITSAAEVNFGRVVAFSMAPRT